MTKVPQECSDPHMERSGGTQSCTLYNFNEGKEKMENGNNNNNTQHQNTEVSDATFPSHAASSNPFNTNNADLKGEFTSHFGTNTSPVSQLFKDGGFGQDQSKKYMLYAAVLVLLLGAGGYFVYKNYIADNGSQGPIISEPITSENNKALVEDTSSVTEEVMEENSDVGSDDSFEEAESAEVGSEPMNEVVEEAPPMNEQPQQVYSGEGYPLVGPENGARWAYDGNSQGMTFAWNTAGEENIVFSKNKNFSSIERKVRARNGSYTFKGALPGNYFWRVESIDGANRSEVRSFRIDAASRLGLSIQSHSEGSTVSDGDTVSWASQGNATHYRVEFAPADSESWRNVKGSDGSSAVVTGLDPGSYRMRVAGFSRGSEQWEYSNPVNVTVQ